MPALFESHVILHCELTRAVFPWLHFVISCRFHIAHERNVIASYCTCKFTEFSQICPAECAVYCCLACSAGFGRHELTLREHVLEASEIIQVTQP